MRNWLLILLVLPAACSKGASGDLPPTCYRALDCCSSLGRDLDDPALRRVRLACGDAKRFAEEGSDEKCQLAMHDITSSFWAAYPSRSPGPTCEGKTP